jgi:hypothetical protein
MYSANKVPVTTAVSDFQDLLQHWICSHTVTAEAVISWRFVAAAQK